jgi:SAM-dependent methyltransferase
VTDDDGYFGEEIAATYDAATSGMHDQSVIDTVVDVLSGLAGGGGALEFGVGSGRIALPLARRGVDVHGIDLSKAMVARMREKRARPDGPHRRTGPRRAVAGLGRYAVHPREHPPRLDMAKASLDLVSTIANKSHAPNVHSRRNPA